MSRVSLFLIAGWAAVVVGGLEVSCSGASKACTPSSCATGCCDLRGACQYGTDNVSCGASGNSCRSCLTSEVCSSGLCVLGTPGGGDAGADACNESNCAGCCRAGTCVTTEDAAACGANGVGCESCTGNQTCTGAGRCQNPTCLGCIDSAGSCQAGKAVGACGAQGFSCIACTSGATCDSTGECTGATCDGCRDTQGVCRAGTSKSVCGANSNICVSCKSTETCSAAGACVAAPAPDAGAGSCNATNCPDGCCNGNACITHISNAQCGKGGGACGQCATQQTCESGTCTACAGCVDFASGTCLGGTTNTSCGKSGNLCQQCATAAGQTCTDGECQGGTCNATSCPNGCCKGTTCVSSSNYTQSQCGSGTKGAACVSCSSSCDLATGVCSTTQTDAGSGLFDDGGFGFPGGQSCSGDGGMQCAVGSCCQNVLGTYTCLTAGTDLLFFKVCGSGGNCEQCRGTQECNLTSYTCQ